MSFGALAHSLLALVGTISCRALQGNRRRLALALGVAVLLGSSSPAGAPAEAAVRYSQTTRLVTAGLRYTKITDSIGPNQIKVLRIDPSTDLTLDVELANDVLPGRETTSSMARRRGAIAAVNGNFGTDWGRPLGLFAEDGKLQTSPIASGGVFALAKDEQSAYVGYPDLDISVRNNSTGDAWGVRDWNDQYPSDERVAGYTNSGGDQVRPPKNACAARLLPAAKPVWGTGGVGLARTYSVDVSRCADRRLLPSKGVVLAAPRGTVGARRVQGLSRGDSIRLTWSLGWAGVMDAIGGSPVLMREGQVMVSACSGYVCQRHPRTGVGVMPNGDILLVTVDGRQSRSVGMNIVEFARLFKRLGATAAMNLDGGGSSTMFLNGRVVNSPSDGSERAVVSSLLVLPRRDYGEPRPS